MFAVANALEDATIPLTAAASFAREDIQNSFITETSPDGDPWERWAESYVDRAEAFPNIGILRRTDELYEAATSSQATIVTSDTVFYDSSGLPARGTWHQEGRPARRTKQGTPNPLPARPFLGLSVMTQNLVFSTFREWFDRAIDLFPTVRGRVGRRHALRGGTGQFIPRSTPLPPRLRAR